MTSERLAEMREQYDIHAEDYCVLGEICTDNFVELLNDAESMQTELARLRRIEEAARAMLDSEFLLKCNNRGATYSIIQHDAELVEKLRKALEAK